MYLIGHSGIDSPTECKVHFVRVVEWTTYNQMLLRTRYGGSDFESLLYPRTLGRAAWGAADRQSLSANLHTISSTLLESNANLRFALRKD